MQTLLRNMRFLCDETRMLTGVSVAYGTPDQSESARYGRAQEAVLEDGAFVPRVRPLEPDSIYDLASLTKLFAAVLCMMLVEEGKLALDEPVTAVDPRFVHLSGVTVADVLGFTVSLQTPGRIDTAPTREEAFARLFAVTPCELPPVRVYSDINAMVVKYVIEARAGMPLAEALQTRILDPLGMRETFAVVPDALKNRCVCYNYEHRIAKDQYILRTDTPLGAPHDPKSLMLSDGGRDLCGHAGLFSTQADMIRFAQALLRGKVISRDSLLAIGTNRTGRPNADGTHRQYLGYLCFTKHPNQHLSEVPPWMSERSIGLSGFTGNHLSLEPNLGRFVLFLGNRCHMRVSNIQPPDGGSLTDYGLDARGVGIVAWPDGRQVPSSAKYVYFKDEMLHAPIERRMRELGWL